MKYIATSNDDIRGYDDNTIILLRNTQYRAEQELKDLLKVRNYLGDNIERRTATSFETDTELDNVSPVCNTSDRVQSKPLFSNEAYNHYMCSCTKCKGFTWVRKK